MSRESRLNRTIKRILQRRLEDTKATRRPLLQRIVRIATLVVGVPSVVAAILTLLPRLSATMSDPVDPDNPFSSSITILNTGFIPLPNTRLSICVKRFTTVGAVKQNVTSDYTRWPCFQNAKWGSHYMGLDDKFTVTMSDFIGIDPSTSLNEATFFLKVTYDMPIIESWERDKLYGFTAYRQTNGRFYWYAETMKELSKD